MKNKRTVRKVLSYIRPFLPRILLTLLLSLGVVAGTLYTPILVGRAIDLCTAGRIDFALLQKPLLAAGILIALTALLQWLLGILNADVTYKVVRNIRKDAIRKIHRLPLAYLDAHSVGDTANRVLSDVDTFSDGLLMGFTQFFTGAGTILGTLIFMLILNFRIALLVVALTPLSLFVAKFIAEHTHDMFLEQSRIKAEQTALINETVSAEKVSIAFCHGEENLKKFDGVNRRLSRCAVRALFYSALTNPSTRVVNNLVYLGVALLGGYFCIGETPLLTVGTLAVFLRYANQYTKPFNEISGVITELQNALACAERIFELLDAGEMFELPAAETIGRADGDVEFDHLSFSYTDEKKLIEDFSFAVKAGQMIAIVGPTGCGKTTLINLLMRFYDVDGGEIRLDGRPLPYIRRPALRKNFGMVLQDTWLREGTIRDNIVIGKPDATDEEVIAAAKASHAHPFIMTLTDGYDTYIGEDGGALSAGQKQLLCISRIMLCLPPVLILDEATSSIDTRTELKIQNAFATLTKGKTSFIVAHRLSTVRAADCILVMKDGNIVEHGKHEELLKQNGFYASLWNAQFSI